MKVRELIEELKKLDQEKDIWIAFEGGYEYGKPLPYGIANEDDKEVKRGDYLIGDY